MKEYVPLSILDWNPAALFPFLWEENEPDRPKRPTHGVDYTRYRREEIFEGGPAIWTGKCPADPHKKLYFEMFEEPDSLYPAFNELRGEDRSRISAFDAICNHESNRLKPGTETDQLYWSVKRLLVDDLMLKLNRDGN